MEKVLLRKKSVKNLSKNLYEEIIFGLVQIRIDF